MMKYFLLGIIALFCSFTNPIEDAKASSYITTYHELAVIEMYRTGIPASITIAQGMHESGLGQSNLAIYANNHFGIKCKSYWQGQTYAHKDDDYDENGKLTKSCFRSYSSAIDSYIDHSNFLTTTAHYAECFQYDKTDYKNWAHALKRCGYATDPAYAEKLINKIDKYNLAVYDTHPNPLKY